MKVYIEKIDNYDLEKISKFLKSSFESSNLWQKLEGKNNILIKPNLLGAYHPDKAVTTNPIVLEALIQILQEKGKNVTLGDSPGGAVSVKKVWQDTGIEALTQKYNIPLVHFSEGGVVTHKTENHEFSTTRYYWDADAVFDVAKYKTHSLMYYTGAVKNLYGLIPGLKKSDYHAKNSDHVQFSTVVSELYNLVKGKLCFSIVDGIWGMEGEGPSAGDPRNFGLMFASESASALDAIASRMLGFKLEQLVYLKEALAYDKISTADIEMADEWKTFYFDKVKIKRVSALIKVLAYSPEFLKIWFQKLFQYYPDFNEKCKKCNICVKSCPVEAMTLTSEMAHPEIDYDKCIKCMCCHEMCPYHAVYIRKSRLAKYVLK